MRDRRAVAPERGRGGLRALAAAVHGDRRGHRRRPPALPLGGRGRRGHAGRGARRRPALPAARAAPRALAEQAIAAEDVPAVDDPKDLLLRLLAAPNICAKTWVYEQYDQVVGSGTVARPGSDAGVVRLTPSERAIAVALDGDGARVALDPRRGGAEAVAQAALNVACSGAEPAAITNCLNFGNPERPGTAYALREAITGMAEACEVLGTPVVSGNVSLYNESGGRPIHPTPVVGCVGVLERAASAVPDGAGRRERLAVPARRAGAGLRRLGVAGPRRRRERRAHPRGRPARAALAVRPARRTRARGRRAALGPRRLRRRPRRRAGRAGAGRRQRPRGRDRAARRRARRRCSASAAASSSRAARPRTRRAWPRRATLRACPSRKSVRWAARRSRCAAASSRSSCRSPTRARPTRARSRSAMAAG